MTLVLEPRETVSRWFVWGVTFAALLVALLISGIVIWWVGGDPGPLVPPHRRFGVRQHRSHQRHAGQGNAPDPDRPRLLAGIPDAAWNIGAEGQFLLGAWGASAVVLFPLLPAGTPAVIVIPAMMLAGAIAGGLWGFIPGVLRARLGVSEIIVTLMLNYIALLWIQYWVFGAWSEAGFQQTKPFPPEAILPRLTDLAGTFPALGGLTVHLGLIFGIVAAAIMWVALERTRWGYEIRLIGDSPRAAEYAGIDIKRKIIVVFVISGALAGLGGMSEVSGVVHRLQDHISPGYGFTAIIIAYLARFGPFRVVVASILFGALILAGREIQPQGVPAMVQGIILFALVGSDVLIRYRVRFDRRLAMA
jgi:simple sugar transport system permease protein